jgi:hypothetical protein
MLFSIEFATAEEVFVLDSASQLQTIERKYMQFLEGYDEHATFEQLQKADWQSELFSNQSFVDGYWVKFFVRNELDSTIIGIFHNLNFEKKIFVNNSLGVFIVALQKLHVFAFDGLQLTCGIQHKNFFCRSKLNTEKHQGQDVK